MHTKEERDAKLRKAQALWRKSKDSAVGEAEAMACIGQIRRLQADIGLTMEEIEAESEAVSRNHFKDGGGMYSGDDCWNYVDNYLAFDIGKFCRVQVGVEHVAKREHGKSYFEYYLHFFGHEADVELAIWLRETIKDAMLFQWTVWSDACLKKGADRARARRDFSMGMAAKLRERMKKIAEGDDEESTALTIRVNALVEKRAQEVGFVIATGQARRAVQIDPNAFGAGIQAGSRVNMGRGVSHRADTESHAASGPKLIK